MTDRPTAWLAGFGVGLLLVSGVGLLLIVAGVSELRWGLTLPVAFGLGLGGTVAVDYAWVAVAWRRQAAADLAQQNAKTELVKAQTEVTLLALDGAAGGDEAGPDDEPDTADLPRLERQREQEVAHWHVFHRRLVQAGCALGWGRDNLTAGTVKVLTQPAWNVGTNNLQQAGFLYKDGAGTRLLVSEADWNAGRLWEKVPAPAGEPPDILPPPYNSTPTRPNNGKTAAGAVVDSVAREVGR